MSVILCISLVIPLWTVAHVTQGDKWPVSFEIVLLNLKFDNFL